MNSLFILSGGVLAASLFFGGGARRDTLGDLIPILMSCVLIGVAYPLARRPLAEAPLFRAVIFALIFVILLQFVPLPPVLWGALPGRAGLYETYVQSGVAPPWAALATRPFDAARSALSILPGLALCFSTICCDDSERRKLIMIVLGVAIISTPIGILQILGGQSSPLYFFDVTNWGVAVGFFANRNHFAALLYCALPFTVAIFALNKQMFGVSLWILGAATVFVLVLGLALSGSRSAVLLGGAAIVASGVYVARTEVLALIKGRLSWIGIALIVSLSLPLAMGVGLLAILRRFDAEDILDDSRWTFLQVSWDAFKSHFPTGAGLGSFERIYQLYEPAENVISLIVNHVHNDWLELALELGILGTLVAAPFICWWALAVVRFLSVKDVEGSLARAALTVIGLLAVHSIWDYPLRTVALSALFGLCCGLTFPAPPSHQSENRLGHRRRRSSRRTVKVAAGHS